MARRSTLLVSVLLPLLALAGIWLPDWMRFAAQISLGVGLATLGLVLLLRCGLVSLGQGLFYCIGGYAIAFSQKYLGTKDIFVATGMCLLSSFAIALVLVMLIKRYREIFFAMLTLAVSMIAYGFLIRARASGGSDGLNVSAPTFFGFAPAGEDAQTAIYIFSVLLVAAATWLTHQFATSDVGKISEAIKGNELRVEYLGYQPSRVVSINYCLGAVLGGLGGLIVAASARHVDPLYAYWTTSAEFVFAALIGGSTNVIAPFIGAILLQILRIVGQEMAPSSWQLILGAAMLLIILLAPSGILSTIQKAVSSQSYRWKR